MSMLSLSHLSSVSCITMVLLQESSAVCWNSVSGLVEARFEDLCLIELLGNFWVSLLAGSGMVLLGGASCGKNSGASLFNPR